MNRLTLFLVPVLVAAGLLAYEAARGRLDGEVVAGTAVFLVVAAVVGAVVHRLSRNHGGG